MASATDPGHSQAPKPTPLKDAGVKINNVNNGNPVWNVELLCNPERSQFVFSTYEDMGKSEAFQMRVKNGEKITRDLVSSGGPGRSADVPSKDEVVGRWLILTDSSKRTDNLLDETELGRRFVKITPGVRRIFLAGLGSMFHNLEEMPIGASIRQHALAHKICKKVVSAAAIQEDQNGNGSPKIEIHFEDSFYSELDAKVIEEMFSARSLEYTGDDEEDIKVFVNNSGFMWEKMQEKNDVLFITLTSMNPYREKMADFIETRGAKPWKPTAVICRLGEMQWKRDHSNSRVIKWLNGYNPNNKLMVTDENVRVMGAMHLHY